MALRLPRSTAPAIAAGPAATPPDASTPISANCDPPENISRLSTQVCQTSSPAVTPSAPNEIPYAETARPTLTACLMAMESSALRAIRAEPSRSCQTRPVTVGACHRAKRRETGGNREADSRYHLCVEDAAEEFCPLPHLGDARPGRCTGERRSVVVNRVPTSARNLIRVTAHASCRGPDSVIVYQHPNALITPPEGNGDGCSLTAVLEGVRQRLLQDAVDGQLRTRPEGKALPRLLEMDLKAGFAHYPEQFARRPDGGLGASIRFRVLDDVSHPAQVVERHPSSFGDTDRRAHCCARIVLPRIASTVSLAGDR